MKKKREPQPRPNEQTVPEAPAVPIQPGERPMGGLAIDDPAVVRVLKSNARNRRPMA